MKTIDFINTQYKSSICKVCVYDCGSKDGSTQYINQKSWESRGIKIDVVAVPNNKRIEECIEIDTKYFMIIFPGYRSYSRDFILDSFNLINSKVGKSIIINKTNKNSYFKKLFSHLIKNKKPTSTDFLLTEKNNLPGILSMRTGELIVDSSYGLYFTKRGIISYQ